MAEADNRDVERRKTLEGPGCAGRIDVEDAKDDLVAIGEPRRRVVGEQDARLRQVEGDAARSWTGSSDIERVQVLHVDGELPDLVGEVVGVGNAQVVGA